MFMRTMVNCVSWIHLNFPVTGIVTPNFMNEETRLREVKSLPKTTQLMRGQAIASTQAVVIKEIIDQIKLLFQLHRITFYMTHK